MTCNKMAHKFVLPNFLKSCITLKMTLFTYNFQGVLQTLSKLLIKNWGWLPFAKLAYSEVSEA